MKKFFKYSLCFLGVIFSIHIIFIFCFGRIDYIGTLKTKYEKINSHQKIITQHFEIETPKNWVHIFNGYGEEGEAIGIFLTKYGKLHYAYDMFFTSLEYDSIDGISRDEMKVGRFFVFVKKEGITIFIHIPRQYEMELPLNFIMSGNTTNNFDDIIKSIETMKFKKFYNYNWVSIEELDTIK